MARTRAFLPPATCGRCNERPALGETLFHTGAAWICGACLTGEVPGKDVTTKMALHNIQAGQSRAISKRERAAGEITEANRSEQDANWNFHAMVAMRDNGTRQVSGTAIVNGEAMPNQPGYLRDTLADPGLIAIESSNSRGQMLHANDVVALGIDVANTAGATNTHEKLLAHQIAVAHKVALVQAAAANRTTDPDIEIKRLQVSARMMQTAQQAMLTLQKLKSGTNHTVVVQHVSVSGNGQAVIGHVAK